MEFCTRLIELRNEMGLTQKELGAVLNITRSTIASYEKENREPKYDILIMIVDYFDVSIDYLLGRSNIKNYKQPPSPIALSEEQQGLLDRYNQLSEQQRMKFIGYCDALLQSSTEPKPSTASKVLYKKEKEIG